MDEAKLLQLLRKNPNTGMKKLMDTYAGLVYAVITRVLPNPGDFASEMEGCVADVFSEFYCELDKYDPNKSSIKTYLCIIARNNAVDLLRRNEKCFGQVSLDDENAVITFIEIENPEDTVHEKQLRRQLLEEIKALGEPDSTILLRKFYYRQSSKDIARDLGLTVSNVDTRTHRALAKLRKQLGGMDE